mmetsp:Transcript_28710/g.39647  ORF Transcript_28710/g.39647 Transcript_28710/m.39647 type:complete len:580 (-) Transcript_28710:145-1884(-)
MESLLFFVSLSPLLGNSVCVCKGSKDIGKEDNNHLLRLRSKLLQKEGLYSYGILHKKNQDNVDDVLMLLPSSLSPSSPQPPMLQYRDGEIWRSVYPQRQHRRQRFIRSLSGGGGGGGTREYSPKRKFAHAPLLNDEKKDDVPTPIVTSSEQEDDIASSAKPILRDEKLVEQIKYENARIEEGLRDGWQGSEGSGTIRIVNGTAFKRLANGNFILRDAASNVESSKRTIKNADDTIKRGCKISSSPVSAPPPPPPPLLSAANLLSSNGSSDPCGNSYGGGGGGYEVENGLAIATAVSTTNNSCISAAATLGVPPPSLPPSLSHSNSTSKATTTTTTTTKSSTANHPSVNPMGRRVTIREWRSGGETYEEVADPKYEIEMALNSACGDASAASEVATETRRKIQDIRKQYGLPESEEASTPHSYTPEPEKSLPDDETWRKMCEMVEKCDQEERADKEAKMRKALGLMQSDGFAKGFLGDNTLQKRELLRKIAATAGDSTISSVDIDDDVTSHKILREQDKRRKKSRASAKLIVNPAVLKMVSSLKGRSKQLKSSDRVDPKDVPNTAKGFTSSYSDYDDTGV